MPTKILTISSAGSDTGPFTIKDNNNNTIASNVSREDLLAGYSVTYSDTATSLTVSSEGDCTGEVSVSVIPPTTTTTTTRSRCMQFDVLNTSDNQIVWTGWACLDGEQLGGTIQPNQTVVTNCIITSSLSVTGGSYTITQETPCS
jgi:hypothetical protein